MQHSPAVRTADLYKRLYSRGWRSKYHSPGRNDLNNGNHENRTSGLAPPSGRKTNDQTSKVAKAYQQQKGAPKLTPCKDEPVQNQQNKDKDNPRPSSRDTVMKDVDIEGLLREPASKEVKNNVEGSAAPAVPVPVDNGAVVNNCTKKTMSGEKPCEVMEEVPFPERSPKRPKRECRIAAEGAAVRQGLRSSTCAI